MLSILTREEILDILSKVKNGTMVRVCYKTELPVKAEFKKQGFKVIKIVETTVRFGVRYNNIASVIARKAEILLDNNKAEKKVITNNYEWIIPNKATHNTNTNKDYLYMATVNKGHHTKSKYIVVDDKFNVNTVRDADLNKDLIINSYWTKTHNEVFNVAFENVIRINKLGMKLF